jgi:Kef-type K+ transport system membrane component KefB
VVSLAVILTAAKAGGHVAVRLGQPAVLGELGAGIVLGNLTLLGFSRLEFLKTDEAVDLLSQLGVILLMFEVGLESTVAQMLEVGASSLAVATLGVAGPLVLGWAVGAWLLPDASVYTHVFLGATLTATSVGITARVLKDLGRANTREARIILGAAVIDDVQGLALLAVVTGITTAAATGAGMSYAAVAVVIAKAMLFLFGALIIGVRVSPPLFTFAATLESSGVLLAAGLVFCFVLAWLSGALGLAPIVGAFAAGLVLEDLHAGQFAARGERTLRQLVEPIASFLVPVFFVMMGIRTTLAALTRPGVIALAAALTVAAVAGKQLCALGVIGRGYDRLSVGIGMIPRGEVGLIFANLGLTMAVGGRRLVSEELFAAIVVMVMATTALTPPALAWSFGRAAKRQAGTRARLQ